MQILPAKPFLDTMIFQVIYGGGYTYLDRCGQTLVDIERARPDWVPGEVNQNTGTMFNEERRFSLGFNVDRFDFTVQRFETIEPVADEARALWDFVRENLNLSEYVRVGCRFHWMLAKQTTEEADKAILRAPMSLTIPQRWNEAGFSPSSRTLAVVLKRSEMEYRVSLQAVVRTEGISPAILITTDPRWLPKGRREARMKAIKNRQTFNANPFYAIDLDVDCVTFNPGKVMPATYIKDQYELVIKEFVPLLNGL